MGSSTGFQKKSLSDQHFEAQLSDQIPKINLQWPFLMFDTWLPRGRAVVQGDTKLSILNTPQDKFSGQ
jgi:hypothetical protein